MPCFLFSLNVKPLVCFFYKLTALFSSHHVTNEQNIPPEPEMVHWQRLTANPDQLYKVLCQTGFCRGTFAGSRIVYREKTCCMVAQFFIETKL